MFCHELAAEAPAVGGWVYHEQPAQRFTRRRCHHCAAHGEGGQHVLDDALRRAYRPQLMRFCTCCRTLARPVTSTAANALCRAGGASRRYRGRRRGSRGQAGEKTQGSFAHGRLFTVGGVVTALLLHERAGVVSSDAPVSAKIARRARNAARALLDPLAQAAVLPHHLCRARGRLVQRCGFRLFTAQGQGRREDGPALVRHEQAQRLRNVRQRRRRLRATVFAGRKRVADARCQKLEDGRLRPESPALQALRQHRALAVLVWPREHLRRGV